MSLIALTHAVSPNIVKGERTYRDQQPIDLARARQQHAAYCDTLRSHGLEVITLEANLDLPDAVFTEDPAVVVDELAVMTHMAAESRWGESAAIAAALAPYRKIVHMAPPACLDGGDVLQVGTRLYVGQSTRTNRAGTRALADFLSPYGYQVIPVPVHDCLHLVTGATALDATTILAATDWIDTSPFEGYRILPVPRDEGPAANILPLDGVILMASGYPQTAELVAREGYNVELIDNSELEKAEGSLTCLSLIFRK